MIHKQVIEARRKLLRAMPSAREILRGALIERTVHHSSGCSKCARGEGHPLTVLTISYPGGRTRQFSLRSEQVPWVRQWLENYRKLREALEAICELNHHFLRPGSASVKARTKAGD